MISQIRSRAAALPVTPALFIIFSAWAIGFIYRASFVASDGLRYFSLFDDAMISMRYSWYLAHGNGLVWNPGEHVEGYTNLLIVLVMALPNLFLEKRLAVLALQLLGGFTVMAVAYLTMRIALFVGRDLDAKAAKTLAWLSLLGALTYYPLAFWSLMGMETGLLAVTILGAVLSYLQYLKTHRASWLVIMGVCMGLAFLARPDSFIASLTILIFGPITDVVKAKNFRNGYGSLIVPIGVFILFPIAQLLFRIGFYGEIAPNTYTLKVVGIPLFFRIRDGLSFITPFLWSVGVVLLVSIAGLVARPRRIGALLVSIPFTLVAYQIFVGGDPWPYWRILAPSIPLLLVAFVYASYALFPARGNSAAKRIVVQAYVIMFGAYLFSTVFIGDKARFTPGIGPTEVLLMAVALGVVLAGILLPRLYNLITPQYRVMVHTTFFVGLAILSINVQFIPEVIFRVRPYTVNENIEMVNKAIAISQLTSDDASVGVFYAGAIPYYTGLYAVDFLGRSDKKIARLTPDLSGAVGWYGMRSIPGHNKYDLNYSLVGLQPTYVQGGKWGTQNLNKWVEEHYSTVEIQGVQLSLRRNDPNVFWDVIPIGE